MLIGCPRCKTRYRVDDGKIGMEGIKLRCVKCRSIFRVMRKKGGELPPPAARQAGKRASSPPERIKVLVANESPSFCEAVKRVLSPEPFDVFAYHDGTAALAATRELRPHVALLDVALPGMYGFEVCEALRGDTATAQVKVILIAAIYDKTRYKRSPQALYGADDYIEKHHIPDELATKIYRLLAGLKPADSSDETAAPQQEEVQVTPQEFSAGERASQQNLCDELRQDEERATVAVSTRSAPGPLPEAHVKARRLARIIASDIALYSQPLVEEGVRKGNFYALLEGDIREGRALFELRVPAEVRSGTSYLEEAFDELIARKRRELNL